MQFAALPGAGISIHALREEGDNNRRMTSWGGILFLSTPSARRATCPAALPQHHLPISIHALREEGDSSASSSSTSVLIFLSTPSARRATCHLPAYRRDTPNFYPRPPRGGRPSFAEFQRLPSGISIHALREEGDTNNLRLNFEIRYFYPRPPRGGRPPRKKWPLWASRFLSTPSARRATPAVSSGPLSCMKFLSTPSARRATERFNAQRFGICDFYPRPPRGGRLAAAPITNKKNKFLSTPSARRATRPCLWHPVRPAISIHALREEGDLHQNRRSAPAAISIHALREEGDR